MHAAPRSTPVLAAVLTIVLGPALAFSAQAQGLEVDGEREFRAACAPCHGVDARGEGPIAAYLNTPPADLTQLARDFGGVFPRLVIRQMVDGRATDRAQGADGGAHGDADMPVWGERFMFDTDREVEPERAEALIRERITAVVAYLEQIQEK